MSFMMNIKLTVESEKTIKEMGGMFVEGRTKICLSTGELSDEHKMKTYWFMPCVFEETDIATEFMVHELPQSITDQIADFIRK